MPAGQFLNQDATLTQEPSGLGEGPVHVLQVRGHRVPVVWKQRSIYNGEEQVRCWLARNSAAELIDGRYQDYLATHPFDTATAFGPGPSGGSDAAA